MQIFAGWHRAKSPKRSSHTRDRAQRTKSATLVPNHYRPTNFERGLHRNEKKNREDENKKGVKIWLTAA